MPRLTTAIATQQHAPMRIGLPPVRTSLTMSVLKPIAAMAMMMKNLLSSLMGAVASAGRAKTVVMTLAIIPITLALAFWQVRQAKRSAEAGEGAGGAAGSFDLKRIFPFFILFFVLASVVTTVFQLPVEVTAPIKELSKFFIVMAMAAIGFNTNVFKLVRSGGKPIFMGFCCWIAISAVSLGIQHVLGIW